MNSFVFFVMGFCTAILVWGLGRIDEWMRDDVLEEQEAIDRMSKSTGMLEKTTL